MRLSQNLTCVCVLCRRHLWGKLRIGTRCTIEKRGSGACSSRPRAQPKVCSSLSSFQGALHVCNQHNGTNGDRSTWLRVKGYFWNHGSTEDMQFKILELSFRREFKVRVMCIAHTA